MAKKILVINPFGIGDVLFSTPLVSTLREAYSESYIAYICNLKTKDILNTNPLIDEVFVFERDEYRNLWKKSKISVIRKFFNFWNGIRKKRFDIVFDLSLGKEYAFMCWLIGIKDRRGFNYRNRGRFLNHRIEFDGFNDKPVAEYYLDLFKEGPINNRSLQINVGAEYYSAPNTVLITTDQDKAYIDNFLRQSSVKDEDTLIGIAPGGGVSFGKKDQDKRRWPAKKFSELADRIIKRFNVKIVLMWGPAEEELVREILGFMTQKALIAPKTSLREMAALCRRCKIVICSEGGPLHIANSQAVVTLSIFGPVDEKVYGPYPPNSKDVIVKSDIACRPCYKRFKLPECETRKCLEDISVDKVFDIISNNFTL